MTLVDAFEQGINFFDTADIYGQGDSERLLGRLFRNKRDKVIFCTKAGLTLPLSQAFIRWAKPFVHPVIRRWKAARLQANVVRQQSERKCFDPTYLRNQIESSLRRLHTDYLDLFLLHSPPKSIRSDESVFAMLINLKKQGKIRHYGVSCDSAEDAMAYLSRNDLACLQVPANLMQPDVLNRVLPAAKEKGIAIISREPLGGGAIFSFSALKEFCDMHTNLTQAQVAVQYVLQRDDTGVILIGMTCRENLYANLNIMKKSPLMSEEIQMLEKQALPPIQG